MIRAVGLLAVLFPVVGSAHYFAFDFVTPSGIGVRTDAGFTAVQWVDGPDPNDLATLTLYAARNGISAFLPAPKDAQFGSAGIPVSDPSNVALWDARAVSPGCYQPFALMSDQIEGTTFRTSAGLITVNPLDGGNLPPAIWVLNQDFEKPPKDGGSFALRLKVEDPDDVGQVAIRWFDGEDAGGTVVQGLPTPKGGGTLTYAFNPSRLPEATVYYLQVEVTGFDGQQCAVWWGGYLPGSLAIDGGTGADAGGEALESDGGQNLVALKGCGCSQTASPFVLLAACVFARRRRRRHPHLRSASPCSI